MNEPDPVTGPDGGSPPPGIYLLAGAAVSPGRAAGTTHGADALEPVCGFRAGAFGPLADRAGDGERLVLFEGILTDRTGDGEGAVSDADLVLERYRIGGLEEIRELGGFFRLLVLEGGRAHLVCDACASRPVYVYEGDGVAALAPSATWFQRRGLPMSLDRQGLYDMFRVNHPVGARSLVREVVRNRPFTVYTIGADGRVESRRPATMDKRPGPRIDIDEMAAQIREVNARVMRGVLEHPRLAHLPVQLALTSGLDSRHLLGELLAQARPPERFVHIRVEETDFAPAAEIAAALDVPLWVRRLDELDLRGLARRWVERTAGLLHFHQLYLLASANEPGHPVVTFDGNLAGLHLSFNLLNTPPGQRHYTKLFLPLLFRDALRRHRRFAGTIRRETAWFDGPHIFRTTGVDIVNRGVHYTGGIFPYLGEHVHAFSPSAHRAAFEFFRTRPEDVGRGKRARLHMLREYYPGVARFPTDDGRPFTEIEAIPPRRWPRPGDLVAALRKRRRQRAGDAPPSLPHEWLRRIPAVWSMLERVVEDSALVRDGHLRGAAVRSLLPLHRLAGLVGWPLMSLVSCEVGYRVLVLGHDPAAVADWLTERAGSRS